MTSPPLGAPRLRAAGIVASFGELTVLRGVTFEVPARQVVGLVGPNGAGKTTLLDVICGVTQPTGGALFFDGRPLRPTTRVVRQLGIARTVQGLGLPGDATVIDHVLAGADPPPRTGLGLALRSLPRAERATGAALDHALQLLREFGIADAADEPIRTLPRATQVGVAIARATVTNPRLVLLDEPAAGLGPDERCKLATLIRRLGTRPGRDCSVLLVEHHRDVVEASCDAVVRLEAGTVVVG